MSQPIPEFSALTKARIVGFTYLFIIVAGIFALGYLPSLIVVPGDPAATIHNIMAREPLYRLALAIHVLITIANVPVAAIFYDLFGRVNKELARWVAFFILVAATIEAVNILNEFAPLIVLANPGAIPTDQLQTYAYTFLLFKDIGLNISFCFVGCYCVTAGWLIVRSAYLPRVIGALLILGGLSYLVNALGVFLAPGKLPFLLIFSFIGELTLTLWMLFGKSFDLEQRP